MSDSLIVVTGAAGRLGTTVHGALLDAGLTVRATDRATASSAARPIVKANLLDERALGRVLKDAKVLVHLAYRREPFGYPDGYPPRTFDDHIRLNRMTFLAACEAGVKRIVFSSTIQVIARQEPGLSASSLPHHLPFDEYSPPQPDNWYGLAKRCSEEMLAMLRRKYGIDYTVLRFPPLIGTTPLTHRDWYHGRLSEGMSYLSHRDAASLITKVIETDLPGGRTYFPASRNNGLGRPAPELIREQFAGVRLDKPAEDIESLVDVSMITREVGWEPLDLSQPEVPVLVPFKARVYRRVLRGVPGALKPFVERRLRFLVP